MDSPILAPVIALVLWSFVMWAWMYATRIPAMIKHKVTYDPHRPVAEFLNPNSELYKERRMAENPPSRDEAIRLMAADPNLIMRPLIRRGDRLLIRPEESALAELAGVAR